MKNDKKMKSLRDMIMISRVKQKESEQTVGPRYLSQKNILPLKQQLEIGSIDLEANGNYQIIENLSESKVLGSLLLK